jgi:hypothetical protein
MEHTTLFYANKITEYKSQAEEIAQDLYKRALNGTISYAEAWFGLPGPAPEVHTHVYGTGFTAQGSVVSRGGTVYTANYHFLPANDVALLKLRFDEEMMNLHETQQVKLASIESNDIATEKRLKEEMDTARTVAEGHLIGTTQRKEQIEVLREKLAALESAYARQQHDADIASRKKVECEQAYTTYISERDDKKRNTRVEVMANDRLIAELRETGTSRQKQETDEYLGLWEKKKSAQIAEEKEAKRLGEELARRIKAEAEQREFEKRIEQEAQARMKDVEFERLVRERMNQLRGGV